MDLKHFAFDVDERIAVALFDRAGEPMNTINLQVAEEFVAIAERVATDDAIEALVWGSAKKSGFLAGADIRYFVKKIKADRIQDIIEFTRKGHELFLRIENAAKPTIAILDGLSMGGGQSYYIGLANVDKFDWVGSFSSGIFASRFSNSSASPSEKYSCSSSELMFTKGRTAIELLAFIGSGSAI